MSPRSKQHDQLQTMLARFPRHGDLPIAGKVALLGELGRGSMGIVLAGWHIQLDIPVAVKILLQHADERLLSRFRREAQISAKLDDPNLLRVLDFGHEGEVPYIVMEWIPGKGLDRVVAAVDRLMEAEVITVLRDVGQALLSLHRQGVVHRDIKTGPTCFLRGARRPDQACRSWDRQRDRFL